MVWSVFRSATTHSSENRSFFAVEQQMLHPKRARSNGGQSFRHQGLSRAGSPPNIATVDTKDFLLLKVRHVFGLGGNWMWRTDLLHEHWSTGPLTVGLDKSETCTVRSK